VKKVFIASLISSIAIFLYLTVMTTNQVSYDRLNDKVIEGKKVWQRKACVECHTIFGNGGYNAPDLTKTLNTRNKSAIRSFLKERPVIRTAKAKRHIKLAEEEIDSVLSYLEFVNTVELNGWPPDPIRLNR